jgi:hypothetical protein
MYDTIEEYNEAIADTKLAIKRAKRIGAESENDSGGSMRKMKEVDLDKLKQELRDLQEEKAQLAGTGPKPIVLGTSW